MSKQSESEERWQLAIEGSNDGIWDWRPQTGHVFYSKQWKANLGYTPDEIRDQLDEWTTRVHPEDLPEVMAVLQKHLRGETPLYSTEHRVRHKDGHYCWMQDRGRAQFNAAGEAVRVTGFQTDITERRRAAEALRDRTEELNTILNLSPDGFVSFDTANRVHYISPAFGRMTRMDPVPLQGLSEVHFWRALAENCSNGLQVLGFAQTLKAQDDTDRHAPVLLELKQPVVRVLDVRRRLSESTTVAHILCFRDVTHETEVDRLKSEFLATAAHELRTPLASVYGFSEILLTQENDPTTQREFLDIVYQQARQMSSILDELLDLARIEARRGKDFSIAPVSAQDILRQIVSGFKVPNHRPAPMVSVPEAELLMLADRSKARQAILNVLSNAYKYSSGGDSVHLQIKAAIALDGEPMVALLITDTGIGMTPQQCSRMFERFYRADFSGKVPGTGLGMAIVKEIIELHKGSIEVQSVIGQGTSVCLLFPRATDPQTP